MLIEVIVFIYIPFSPSYYLYIPYLLVPDTFAFLHPGPNLQVILLQKTKTSVRMQNLGDSDRDSPNRLQKNTQFCQVAFAKKEKTCQSHLATSDINKQTAHRVNPVVSCVSTEQWEFSQRNFNRTSVFTKLLAR